MLSTLRVLKTCFNNKKKYFSLYLQVTQVDIPVQPANPIGMPIYDKVLHFYTRNLHLKID
jgi:hypothetical protein